MDTHIEIARGKAHLVLVYSIYSVIKLSRYRVHCVSLSPVSVRVYRCKYTYGEEYI